ncbi:MAG: arabinogalactan endo-1,4-beta-galactosidase [Cellulophaga sp.]|nr:arabinogalactan endo-1,4-beta-galactosidase [Cellulophaga sp.]
MKHLLNFAKAILCMVFMILASCTEDEILVSEKESVTIEENLITAKAVSCNTNIDFEIKAMDVSFLPQLEAKNLIFKNSNNQAQSLLPLIKGSGVNTIRLRLWMNNTGIYGYNEVKKLSDRAKTLGFKTWISIHYRDTWADLNNQNAPTLWGWNKLNLPQLEDAVKNYTKNVVSDLKPDYVQIGNETNLGMLLPIGNFKSNLGNFKSLVKAGIKGAKEGYPCAKTIIHYAGIGDAATNYFKVLWDLDYDIMAVSYYPFYNEDLNDLKSTLIALNTINKFRVENSNKSNLRLLIAETAYPFTLKNDDKVKNIIRNYKLEPLEVGEVRATLLTRKQYPANTTGQSNYIKDLRNTLAVVPNTIGFGYWGGEYVAFSGINPLNNISGSNYDNLALFYRFDKKKYPKAYKVLPALNEFKK